MRNSLQHTQERKPKPKNPDRTLTIQNVEPLHRVRLDLCRPGFKSLQSTGLHMLWNFQKSEDPKYRTLQPTMLSKGRQQATPNSKTAPGNLMSGTSTVEINEVPDP